MGVCGTSCDTFNLLTSVVTSLTYTVLQIASRASTMRAFMTLGSLAVVLAACGSPEPAAETEDLTLRKNSLFYGDGGLFIATRRTKSTGALSAFVKRGEENFT